jgi:hypothetical protein
VSPIVSLLLIVAAGAIPCALAERAAEGTRVRRSAERVPRALAIAGLAWALSAVAWYWVVIRASIGSMDFFLHVCSARDLFEGRGVEGSGVLASYRLFPGVFVFWRTAMHVFGTSLADLQWAYVALLGADALLVGAVVARAACNIEAGLFAFVLAGYLFSGLEARQGHLEPIALLPALAGVLAWGGEPLRGRAGIARALALGAGFGLALFSRQQAGTLALGALALLPGAVWGEPERRHRISVLALVPSGAVAAFALALLLEGRGLDPLRRGLGFVHEYPGRSSFVENCIGLAPWARNGVPTILLGLVSGLVWIALLFTARGRAAVTRPRVALAGLAAASAAATLIQLARRPYIHYLQLTAPFAAIAAFSMVSEGVPTLPEPWRRSAAARVAGIGLAASLLLSDPARPDHFGAWPPRLIPASTLLPSWERVPEVAADLAQLREVVAPGEDVVVVPPYRNEVHFLLGTRSDAYDEGYFMDMIPEGMLPHMRWERAQSVLVLRAGDREARELWRSQQCDAFVAALPEHGFREVARLRTMSLWRRASR